MPIDIILSPAELAIRGTPYNPIRPVPAIYTHVGDAKNHGTGRRLPIRLIIDHTTEGDSTSIVGSMRYDARRTEMVSCTAFTGEDGIGYDVAETNRPFTTGRWNDESLSNETVGKAAWPAVFWRTERATTIHHKIDLFTDWCQRFHIPAVWLSAEEIAKDASRQGLPMRAGFNRGICDHLEANRAAILLGGSPAQYSHHDVGVGMRDILIDHIIPAVAERLNPPPPPPPVPSSEVEMIILNRKPGTPEWDAMVWTGTHLSGLRGGRDTLLAAGVQERTVPDDDEMDRIIHSGQTTNDCPPSMAKIPRLAQSWMARQTG